MKNKTLIPALKLKAYMLDLKKKYELADEEAIIMLTAMVAEEKKRQGGD